MGKRTTRNNNSLQISKSTGKNLSSAKQFKRSLKRKPRNLKHNSSFSKKRNARKTFRRRAILLLSCCIFLAFLCYGTIALLGKIFAVDNIYVSGNVKYDSSEIIKLSGINKGENILFLNSKSAENAVVKVFPYIDDAKVSKHIFRKSVEISITSGEPAYAIQNADNPSGEEENKYILLSKKFKALENRSELTPEIILITGADYTISDNGFIIYKSDFAIKAIKVIEDKFKSHGLSSIKEIDVSNPENLIAVYDYRIKIILGNLRDVDDYKLLTAKEIITNKIGQREKGTLDLRTLKHDNRSYFNPED